MIVIASHDKLDSLQALLFALCNMDVGGHEILVVDTNSRDPSYRNRISDILQDYPSVKYQRIYFDCWDSGAYILSYKNTTADSYIFLQDSIYINNSNFVLELDRDLLDYDAAAYMGFDYDYDYDFHYVPGWRDAQIQWVESDLQDIKAPTYGIFGPMFAIRRSALDAIPEKWLEKFPTNKMQQQGMERRWSLMLHTLGLNTKFRKVLPHWSIDSLPNVLTMRSNHRESVSDFYKMFYKRR